MQRSQRLSMLSSGVNEGFHSAGPCLDFCRTRRKQDDSLHTHCANLNTVAWPITVEIWRTFFWALGASAICSFSLPLWMFTTGCPGVVLVVLSRLVRSVGHLVTALVNLFVVFPFS